MNNPEEGQSVVEFALLLPLLLTLLCGIIDFGWIYANQYKVEYAAYTGARYAALNAASAEETELKSGITERVLENLYGDGTSALISISIGSDSVSVSVSYPVKTLTFVAGALFGNYYNAGSTNVAAY